jgi:hypothetical protein
VVRLSRSQLELALVTALLRNAFCMVHKAYNRISLRDDSTAVAEEEETRNVGGRYRVSSHRDLGGWPPRRWGHL